MPSSSPQQIWFYPLVQFFFLLQLQHIGRLMFTTHWMRGWSTPPAVLYRRPTKPKTPWILISDYGLVHCWWHCCGHLNCKPFQDFLQQNYSWRSTLSVEWPNQQRVYFRQLFTLPRLNYCQRAGNNSASINVNKLFGYVFTTLFSLCDTITTSTRDTFIHFRAVNFIFDSRLEFDSCMFSRSQFGNRPDRLDKNNPLYSTAVSRSVIDGHFN